MQSVNKGVWANCPKSPSLNPHLSNVLMELGQTLAQKIISKGEGGRIGSFKYAINLMKKSYYNHSVMNARSDLSSQGGRHKTVTLSRDELQFIAETEINKKDFIKAKMKRLNSEEELKLSLGA